MDCSRQQHSERTERVKEKGNPSGYGFKVVMEEICYKDEAKTAHYEKEFYIFSFSILLTMCSYAGLMDLQSSMNVTEGLGNKALMLMSITTIIVGLLLTPVLIRRIGPRATLIISDLCFLIFVVANFYPVSYLLLPAGILMGFGEALYFTPYLIYATYYGRMIAKKRGKDSHVYINRYVGYSTAIYQMNEIFSNLISAIVLNVGRNFVLETEDKTVNGSIPEIIVMHTSLPPNTSTSVNTSYNGANPTEYFANSNSNYDFTMCGANDCYITEEIDFKLNNYVPLSITSYYIMVGIYTLLGATAIPLLLLITALPNDEKLYEESLTLVESSEEESNGNEKDFSTFAIIKSNVRRTLRHLTDLQQILLVPLTLYHGLMIAFVSSEINRAYVSCTVGVEQVGIGMCAGGIANALTCFVFGAISGRKCLRNFLYAGVIVLDLALYLFCLYWRPTAESSWLAYTVCILFGVTDGVWEPFIAGKYAKYFPDTEEVAYSVSLILTLVGSGLTYGWTTLLCLTDKLYIQMAVLVIGVVCAAGAEIKQGKKLMNKTTTELDTTA